MNTLLNADHIVDALQCHKLRSFSGWALSIISANIEGLSGAKKNLLADLCMRNKCGILCLQETHRGDTRIRHRISGMTLVIERPHYHYGSTIFVRSGIAVEKSSRLETDNIEVLNIKLRGISVNAIYEPQNEEFHFLDSFVKWPTRRGDL